MIKVSMKTFRIKELSFANSVENGTKISFENKYSYNVNYAQNNICKGEMSVSAISKENPDKFFIKVVMEGIFEYNVEMTKEQVHIATFKHLFPYVRAAISTVSGAANVPPIIVPEIDIESQSIYRYDMSQNPFLKKNSDDDDDEED